jgi:hypothetical protein
MMIDTNVLSEDARLHSAGVGHDVVRWHCHTRLDKLTVPAGIVFPASWDGLPGGEQASILRTAGVKPVTVEVDGNLLMFGGASNLWQSLIGNGTTTGGQTLTYFSNAQAAIGVGDSSTAAVATHTDLQAATNKLRVAMDATFPQHTDGVISGAASIVFRSTFSTAQANFAWQEWAVFNSASGGTGRMLQRKVESLGTKTSASTWTLTLTLSLA